MYPLTGELVNQLSLNNEADDRLCETFAHNGFGLLDCNLEVQVHIAGIGDFHVMLAKLIPSQLQSSTSPIHFSG